MGKILLYGASRGGVFGSMGLFACFSLLSLTGCGFVPHNADVGVRVSGNPFVAQYIVHNDAGTPLYLDREDCTGETLTQATSTHDGQGRLSCVMAWRTAAHNAQQTEAVTYSYAYRAPLQRIAKQRSALKQVRQALARAVVSAQSAH